MACEAARGKGPYGSTYTRNGVFNSKTDASNEKILGIEQRDTKICLRRMTRGVVISSMTKLEDMYN